MTLAIAGALLRFVLVPLAVTSTARQDQESRPLPARWELPRGPYYLGQGIEARIIVIAGTSRPTLEIAPSKSTEVVTLGGVEVRPIAASGIGEMVERTNEYRLPVRIIIRRSGSITLPAITVNAEERSGRVRPRTITVLAPPALGRTGTFLGGVGRIEATAEARPNAVAVGDPFEYRIRLDGPGSVGSIAPPKLAGLDRLGLGLRTEPLPAEATVEPPSRTLRFRLRATRAGSRSLPAFLISWLDPVSGKYMTSASRAVAIRVEDVPEFDPERLDLPTVPNQTRARIAWPVIGGIVALVVSGGLLLGARLNRRRNRLDNPARLAAALVGKLGAIENAEDGAAASVDAVAEFLHRVGGRESGVLTPPEARSWVLDLTDDEGLAVRAESLIVLCDRRLYDERRGRGTAGNAVGAASELLLELGRKAKAGKPREAPGTA